MDEIKAELSARLPSGVAFEIPLFGGIPVPQSTVMTWIIIGVITVLCIWLTHNLKERGRRQMVAEVLVGFINNFCKENLGKHWRTFAPLSGHGGGVSGGVQHLRPVWLHAPHQGSERGGGPGHHERGADLCGPV